MNYWTAPGCDKEVQNYSALEDIISEIIKGMKDFGVRLTREDFNDRSKERNLVYARFIYFRRAILTTNFTLKIIGEQICRRHCAVLSGLKAFNRYRTCQLRYNYIFAEKKEKPVLNDFKSPFAGVEACSHDYKGYVKAYR